ncbi:MAG: selenocysteine-specific translation elongation factor [Fimbriiglobus sp.]
MRDLILGTAGHIDHGKTALIQALTGTNCDRLPEEKARGITIDIGFASLELPGVRFGIVDVPGHEKFVRNMLAGATGFDVVLLIIAADDGIMPQSREHLEILDFLGVSRGIVVLTKADLVDSETLELRRLEIEEWLRPSRLQAASILPVSSLSGTGIPELRAELTRLAAEVPAALESGPFVLAIDRAFSVAGHGTVVTGTVASGRVAIEEEVTLHRADGIERQLRVRGLHQHHTAVSHVIRGQRAAINLAGLELDEVGRGDTLSTSGALLPSRLLSVQVRASGSSRGLRQRLPVRVHLGTSDLEATLLLLDADTIRPGQTGLAQLYLRGFVSTSWGQRFVLRDSSGSSTLAGGVVLQPLATPIRRRSLAAIEHLERLASAEATSRISAAVWFTGFEGLPRSRFHQFAGTYDTTAEEVITFVKLPDRLFHRQRITEIEAALLARLGSLHQQQPICTNHAMEVVLSTLTQIPPALLKAVTQRLTETKSILASENRLSLASFQPKLSQQQRKWKEQIVRELADAGLAPPEWMSFLPKVSNQKKLLSEILEVACAEGQLVAVSAEFYLHKEAEQKLIQDLIRLLSDGRGRTVSEIRDALQTSRKYAVPFCEYLDRIQLTWRVGDVRVLVSDPE